VGLTRRKSYTTKSQYINDVNNKVNDSLLYVLGLLGISDSYQEQ